MATPTPPPPNVPVPPAAETTAVGAAAVDQTKATSKPPAKKAAAKKAVAKEAVAKQYLRFRAKTYPIHHPYQNLKVPLSGSVKMEVDSWVECQRDAGIIFEVAE